MFTAHHLPYKTPNGLLRPDRRPLPGAHEIRLRVKRFANR